MPALALCLSRQAVAAPLVAPLAGPPPADVAASVRLARVASGFAVPVALVQPPGDSRLFVVEKTGRVRALANGKPAARPFINLSAQVSGGSEQGLLGLAFHPRFRENHRLFVNYTDTKGNTHVIEYKAPGDAVDPGSAREWLYVEQPYANHNGGNLVFGPDGKLYVGLGDGGSARDPHGNGQNPKAFLGKMLTLDVDAHIPAPQKPKPEIALLGLRNPWRYSFDRQSGDLYIADVGQDRYEEIDVIAAAALTRRGSPLNLGWNIREGAHCLRGDACDAKGLVEPVVEYTHQEGCSVTGGFVYRGKAIPQLAGAYFYSDYCTALLRSFRWRDGRVQEHWDWKEALDPKRQVQAVASFGEDNDGEIYVVSLTGVVYKLVRGT